MVQSWTPGFNPGYQGLILDMRVQSMADHVACIFFYNGMSIIYLFRKQWQNTMYNCQPAQPANKSWVWWQRPIIGQFVCPLIGVCFSSNRTVCPLTGQFVCPIKDVQLSFNSLLLTCTVFTGMAFMFLFREVCRWVARVLPRPMRKANDSRTAYVLPGCKRKTNDSHTPLLLPRPMRKVNDSHTITYYSATKDTGSQMTTLSQRPPYLQHANNQKQVFRTEALSWDGWGCSAQFEL